MCTAEGLEPVEMRREARVLIDIRANRRADTGRSSQLHQIRRKRFAARTELRRMRVLTEIRARVGIASRVRRQIPAYRSRWEEFFCGTAVTDARKEKSPVFLAFSVWFSSAKVKSGSHSGNANSQCSGGVSQNM